LLASILSAPVPVLQPLPQRIAVPWNAADSPLSPRSTKPTPHRRPPDLCASEFGRRHEVHHLNRLDSRLCRLAHDLNRLDRSFVRLDARLNWLDHDL